MFVLMENFMLCENDPEGGGRDEEVRESRREAKGAELNGVARVLRTCSYTGDTIKRGAYLGESRREKGMAG